MPKRMSRRRALASSSVLAAVSGVALVAASPSTANPAKGFGPGQIPHVYATSANPATRAAAEGTDAGGDSLELADQAQQYAAARTAPSGHVPAAAWAAAFAAAQRLPAAGGTWSVL
jgi:hypothetical protein